LGQRGDSWVARAVGARTQERKREGRPTTFWLRVLRKKKTGRGRKEGRLGRKERGRGGRVWFFSFFKILFKLFFKLCKLHSNNKTMHSNHNAQALIISNIIEMIFKYFKGQFYLII
jgi:hypothetical protein